MWWCETAAAALVVAGGVTLLGASADWLGGPVVRLAVAAWAAWAIAAPLPRSTACRSTRSPARRSSAAPILPTSA
jgi:hypothetical protein